MLLQEAAMGLNRVGRAERMSRVCYEVLLEASLFEGVVINRTGEAIAARSLATDCGQFVLTTVVANNSSKD